MKKSTIGITITLDDKNIPERIDWQASDLEQNKEHEAKAMMISFFDKDHRDTLKFDLWTKEMQVQEMDRFVYYTLRSLADTYVKATNNNALANQIQKFAQYFGEETEIVPIQS